jgi:hypothetical protein
MTRYVTGKSRFVVATVNGQRGYAVFRLDGRLHDRDRHLTPVYSKIRTRQRAEQVARRLAHRGLLVTNTKFHIPLDTKQEQMRRRHDPAPGRPVPAVPVELERHFETSEVAELGWAGSIWSVRRRLAKLPGVVRQISASGRVSMTIPASVLKAYHESLTRRDR